MLLQRKKECEKMSQEIETELEGVDNDDDEEDKIEEKNKYGKKSDSK